MRKRLNANSAFMSESKPLNQVIDLIRKTGERCIVVDDEETPYAVMSLKEYERLIFSERQIQNHQKCAEDLTSHELLDKINQEIALWKAKENNGAAGDGLNLSRIIHLKKAEEMKNGGKNFSNGEMGGQAEKERYFSEALD